MKNKRLVLMLALLSILMGSAYLDIKPVQAEVINIGFTGPLSGGAAKYGKNNLEGLQMAVDEINAAGGITVGGKNYTFKVIALDDRYKPADSVTNARRMVELNKPPIIVCVHSGGILGLLKFNEQEGFILHGYTDNPSILKLGNKLLIKAPLSMAFYNSVIIDAGWKQGWKKAALICGSHEAGKMAEKAFEELWKDKGGTIVANAPADYGKVTDFYPYLTKILAAKPDCIMLYGPSEPSALIINTARELGFKGGFLLGSQCKLDEMAKVASLQVLSPSYGVCPVSMMPLAGVKDFSKRYEQKFHNLSTSESGYNYEVMYIFAEAMKKAGTVTDLNKIMASIPQVIPMSKHMVRGIHTMTKEGQFLSANYIMGVVDGKFIPPIEADPRSWYKKFGATYMPE